MQKPDLIGRLPGTTPHELRSSQGHVRALPKDLVREASMRLGIMSLLAAALWVLGTLLGHIAFVETPAGGEYFFRPVTLPADAISAGSILVSLALFVYTRRGKMDPARMLDLGLVYMVVLSLAIGLMFHLALVYQGEMSMLERSVRPEISWIGASVLMFAAVLPSSPGKFLVAALLAVSMNPVGMLISSAQGRWDFGPASNVLLMHYPDYLLVGVGMVISRVVTQLGRHVAKARELGSYQVGDLLGKGGMGEVYRATHRMLARPAAIKLIRPEMLGGKNEESARLAVKRFCREAEAAANLRSPHTVEVYDFGITDDETFYLVMEMLEGMDLESMVKRHGPLPEHRVIHILRQVCDSLQEAHLKGLVHRDIKPANIHVGRLGLRHDFAKVLDFGLVKPIAHRERGDTLATQEGLTPGTPAYMAPEILQGEPVDGRADIYALGCVAYFLLTGKLVFQADNAMQMVIKHITEDPDPPSRRGTQPVSAAMDEVVLACLAKEPSARHATAAHLDRALAAIEAEQWGEEQAAKWWQGVTAPA